MATIAEQLAAAAALDALNRTEAELSNSGKWSEWWWNRGQDTTTGWTQKASNNHAAAIWTAAEFAPPCYAIVKLAKPLTTTRGLTIALCKVPGEETFLCLSVLYVSSSKVKLFLEKVEKGTETELASVEVEYKEGDRFALTVQPGTNGLKAWRQKEGAGAFTEALAATPPSLAEFGSTAAIAMFGETTTNSNRVTGFAAGTLVEEGPPRGSLLLLGAGR
jgi:hypothetical protein